MVSSVARSTRPHASPPAPEREAFQARWLHSNRFRRSPVACRLRRIPLAPWKSCSSAFDDALPTQHPPSLRFCEFVQQSMHFSIRFYVSRHRRRGRSRERRGKARISAVEDVGRMKYSLQLVETIRTFGQPAPHHEVSPAGLLRRARRAKAWRQLRQVRSAYYRPVSRYRRSTLLEFSVYIHRETSA